MIGKLLVANRGEVARRIISTCRRLGIRTVAVFSEADRDALHVRMADQAVFLGPAPPAESYLNTGAILEAARLTGADALHPGYGFLAENADFAGKVEEAGLAFVGPRSAVIRQMGSKTAARQVCLEAGVPVVPGSPALPDRELLARAEEIGFPLMLKSSAGGGGKGMRHLQTLEALREALPSARREALKAFGSDEMYLEKAVSRPRHLEVQLLGDQHGNVVHLGVRECSLQRRHQKIIEEAPPAGTSPKLLQGLTEAALRLARAVDYTSLGTVEFLVDGEEFYFLEMNTRLQVEHPVTEMTTGLDLVELQIAVAQNEPLPLSQSQVFFAGHAVEARIACEDPYNGFLPTTGTVLEWDPCLRVRVDSCLEKGSEITPHYDSMVAKVIAWSPTRPGALRLLGSALNDTVFLGVSSNIDYLRRLLATPEVRGGNYHTNFVESLEWAKPAPTEEQHLAATAARYSSISQNAYSGLGSLAVELEFQNLPTVAVLGNSFQLEGRAYPFSLEEGSLTINNHRFRLTWAEHEGQWWIHTHEGTICLQEVPRWPSPGVFGVSGSLAAPMPGTVVEILTSPGERVGEGQTLLKLEAMKMEQVIRSPRDGVVETVHFRVGEQVEAGAALITLAEEV